MSFKKTGSAVIAEIEKIKSMIDIHGAVMVSKNGVPIADVTIDFRDPQDINIFIAAMSWYIGGGYKIHPKDIGD